jgi:hypothetical protein
MFVALNGLENVVWPAGMSGFEIDVVLAESWSHDLPFSTENIRLHCVPVINLFPEADPLHLSPLENEYLLRPMRIQDGHTKFTPSIILFLRDTPAVRHMCPFPVFATGAGCCVTIRRNVITIRG